MIPKVTELASGELGLGPAVSLLKAWGPLGWGMQEKFLSASWHRIYYEDRHGF